MVNNDRGIPDILYHGTTMLRWKLMEKEGYLSPNNEGHIYFTNDVSDAKRYAYARYLQDIIYSSNRLRSLRRITDVTNKEPYSYHSYCYNINPNLRDSIILKITTSDIIDILELDTEWECTYHLRTSVSLQHVSIYRIHKLSDEDLCERNFIESGYGYAKRFKQPEIVTQIPP
jgi:hypothetical protein